MFTGLAVAAPPLLDLNMTTEIHAGRTWKTLIALTAFGSLCEIVFFVFMPLKGAYPPLSLACFALDCVFAMELSSRLFLAAERRELISFLGSGLGWLDALVTILPLVFVSGPFAIGILAGFQPPELAALRFLAGLRLLRCLRLFSEEAGGRLESIAAPCSAFGIVTLLQAFGLSLGRGLAVSAWLSLAAFAAAGAVIITMGLTRLLLARGARELALSFGKRSALEPRIRPVESDGEETDNRGGLDARGVPMGLDATEESFMTGKAEIEGLLAKATRGEQSARSSRESAATSSAGW